MVDSSSSPANRPFHFIFKTEDKTRIPYVIEVDTDTDSILVMLHTLLNLAKTDDNVKGILAVFYMNLLRTMTDRPPSSPAGPHPNMANINVEDINSAIKMIQGMLSASGLDPRIGKSKVQDLFKDDTADPRKDKKLTD